MAVARFWIDTGNEILLTPRGRGNKRRSTWTGRGGAWSAFGGSGAPSDLDGGAADQGTIAYTADGGAADQGAIVNTFNGGTASG